jgi:threonine dehydratase
MDADQDLNLDRIEEAARSAGPIKLLRAGSLDAVVLPVSDGTLITGAGRWIKARSPGTRIIGVCPAAAPAVALSWRAGRVVRAEPAATIAGLAAIACHDIQGATLATVLTGADPASRLLA